MPPIEQDFRFQLAVLWQFVGYDAHGKATVSAPVELAVRWDDTVQQTLGAQESIETSSTKLVVGQDVPELSIFWRGALADLPEGNNPGNLYRVESVTKTPDVKGRQFFRTCMLVKYADTLPVIVS
jgi:hypothetical protein